MSTYCKAEMKFIDVTAQSDAEINTMDATDFSRMSLFYYPDPVEYADYAHIGQNHFVLDGSKEIMPNNLRDAAFWSRERSNSNCEFTHNPTVDISFMNPHSSSGITLYFNTVYPDTLKVTWYRGSTKLAAETYHPDGLMFICAQKAQDYNRIEIEFIKTNLPGEYIQLQYMLYGRHILWGINEIKNAKITEELDLTGATIPINKASIDIIDGNEQFNMSSNVGEWQFVQKNQKVNIYEIINEDEDNPIVCGSFYISDFSFKENVATFNFVDGVGVLDLYTFEMGTIYDKVPASTIIAAIFENTGVEYEVAPEVGSILLSGYLAIQSCRSALQLVAFMCNAVVDDSRSDVVKIYKPNKEIVAEIPPARKFNGQTKIALDEYVSGVSIEFSKYSLASDRQEIYNDILTEGQHKITFNGPYKASTITTSVGTIVEVNTNYVVISVPSDSAIIISGIPYNEAKFSVTKTVGTIQTGEFENTKTFSGCTLYNSEAAQEKLEELLKYYKLRKKVDCKYLLNSEGVGNWVNIKDTKARNNASVIESQSIDLTGGFIATAKCRGYDFISTEYYTGTELYTNGTLAGGLL